MLVTKDELRLGAMGLCSSSGPVAIASACIHHPHCQTGPWARMAPRACLRSVQCLISAAGATVLHPPLPVIVDSTSVVSCASGLEKSGKNAIIDDHTTLLQFKAQLSDLPPQFPWPFLTQINLVQFIDEE